MLLHEVDEEAAGDRWDLATAVRGSRRCRRSSVCRSVDEVEEAIGDLLRR